MSHKNLEVQILSIAIRTRTAAPEIGCFSHHTGLLHLVKAHPLQISIVMSQSVLLWYVTHTLAHLVRETPLKLFSGITIQHTNTSDERAPT